MAKSTEDFLSSVQATLEPPEVEVQPGSSPVNLKSAGGLAQDIAGVGQEILRSTIKVLPNSLEPTFKLALSESIPGLALQAITGERTFPELETEELNTLEHIAGTVISFLDPVTMATFVFGGGVGGVATKLTLKAAAKGLAKAGLKKELAETVAGKILVRAGSSAGALGTLTGVSETLVQAREREFNIERIFMEAGKSALVGAAAGGIGGSIRASVSATASKATKMAAAIAEPTGEVLTFGTVAPLLEGRHPEFNDYVQAAGVIGGIKAIGALRNASGRIRSATLEGKREISKVQARAKPEPATPDTAVKKVEGQGSIAGIKALFRHIVKAPEPFKGKADKRKEKRIVTKPKKDDLFVDRTLQLGDETVRVIRINKNSIVVDFGDGLETTIPNAKFIAGKAGEPPEFRLLRKQTFEPVEGLEEGPLTENLFHGSSTADIKALKPGTTGDFGSGVYITSDPTLAAHFGGGKDAVYSVRFKKKPKKVFSETNKPLTAAEYQWWVDAFKKIGTAFPRGRIDSKGQDTGQAVTIRTHGDLIKEQMSRNLEFDASGFRQQLGTMWGDFLKAFDYDVAIADLGVHGKGNEILIRDPSLVEINRGFEQVDPIRYRPEVTRESTPEDYKAEVEAGIKAANAEGEPQTPREARAEPTGVNRTDEPAIARALAKLKVDTWFRKPIQFIQKLLAIEPAWTLAGFPETGKQVKGWFSTQITTEEIGADHMREIVERLRSNNPTEAEFNADKVAVIRAFDNVKYIDTLPARQQHRIRKAYTHIVAMNAEIQKLRRAMGIQDKGFIENAIERVKKQLAQSENAAERAELKELLEDLKDQKFLHMPVAEIIYEKFRSDPGEARRTLQFLTQKSRTTLKFEDLYESGIMKEGSFDIFDVTSAYFRRLGKDIATANYLNAAKREGAIVSAKSAAKDSVKQYWEKLPGNIPALRGGGEVRAHPLVAEWLVEYSTPYRERNILHASMAITKMAQFWNPAILPMMDIVQSAMLGPMFRPLVGGLIGTGLAPGFGTVAGVAAGFVSKPASARAVRDAAKAFGFNSWRDGLKAVRDKNQDYWDAQANFIASTPYTPPWDNYVQTRDHIRRTKGGFLTRAVEAAADKLNHALGKGLFKADKGVPIIGTNLRINPFAPLIQLYQASWAMTWGADRFLRQISYQYLREQGFSPREAAQIAARAHADYAGTPAKTRRRLNLVFFTPTFHNEMGKFYIEMAKGGISAAKSPIKYARTVLGRKGAKIDPRERVMADSMIRTASVVIAFDWAMTNLGFQTEVFGWKYSKRAADDDGVDQDLVLTFSNPANMWLKYWSRTSQAFDPDIGKPLMEALDRNKWVFHPIHRNIAQIITNEDGVGQQVYNTLDSPMIKARKSANWFAQELIPIYNRIAEDRSDLDAANVELAKETGRAFDWTTRFISFRNLRSPIEKRLHFRLRRLDESYRDDIRSSISEGNFQHVERLTGSYRDAQRKIIKRFGLDPADYGL